MKREKKKITCSKCGIEMNHHAEKLKIPETDKDMEYYDEDMEGVIEQYHRCPQCGEEVAILVTD